MRLSRLSLASFVAGASLFAGMAMADYVIKDGNGNFQTVVSYLCQSFKICPAQVLIDSAGNEKATFTNPLRIGGGGVTVTGVVSGTVSGTKVYQTGVAANASRQGCAIHNKSDDGLSVVFGPTASATSSIGIGVGPWGTLSCDVGGMVVQDNIAITGTAGDAYVIYTW